MKIRVFQAGKGDCLLLTGNDGTRILADGGMRADYRTHVAPVLARIRERGGALDLVYVSHIDRDHISGVLQLMDDLVAWRVFDYQRESGNQDYPEPESPRPPEVRELWHNAFHELVTANRRAVERAIAASANALITAGDSAVRAVALEQRELATSISEGIELSRRVGPEQLGIPLNRHFEGKLALVRKAATPIQLGAFTLTVIGPFARDLRHLRDEWNTWLRSNAEQLERLRERMERDVRRLATNDFNRLRRAVALGAGDLGDRTKVTTPNLASLMLLVEEDGRSVLLTGDGHSEDVLAGLEEAGRLDAEGKLHVDVLKVQHHGSEHNLTPEFAKLITANRYLFCANGEHANPDPRIVQAIIESRLGSQSVRSASPSANGRFTLQFNSSVDVTQDEEQAHMKAIEEQVAAAAAASSGRMRFTFLNRSSFDINLN